MSPITPVRKKEEQPVPTPPPAPASSKAKWLIYGVVVVTALVVALVLSEMIYKVCLAIKSWWSGKKATPDENVREVFKPLVDTVSKFTTVAPSAVFDKLPLTNQDEQKVLKYLQSHYEITPHELQEILKGAHVYLDDSGKAYDHWRDELDSINQRVSSHPSSEKQYAVRGPLVKEMLFSRLDQYTWFQLENNPMTFGCVTSHMLDYFRYKITGYNQGPFGSSMYRHNNPLILKPKKDATKESTPPSRVEWQASDAKIVEV